MKKLITAIVSFLMLFTVAFPITADDGESVDNSEVQVLAQEGTEPAQPLKKYAPDFVAEVDDNGDLYIRSEAKDWLNGINHIELALTNGTVSTTAEEAAQKGGNMYIITNYPTDDDSKLTKEVSGGPAPAYDGSMAYDSVDYAEIENAYKSYGTIDYWVYAEDNEVEFNIDNGYIKVTKDSLKARGLTSGKYILYVRSSGYYYGYQKDVEFDYIAPRPLQVETGQSIQLTVGTNRKVTWSTSDETVVTIDDDGYATFNTVSPWVEIYASIDGNVVDVYSTKVVAGTIDITAVQNDNGDIILKSNNEEFLKALETPYINDENDSFESAGGRIQIGNVSLNNFYSKKYDYKSYLYNYVEDGNDSYILIPFSTLLERGITAGYTRLSASHEDFEDYDVNDTGINIHKGCLNYPDDIVVSENENGDLIIRTSNTSYLKTLVENPGEDAGYNSEIGIKGDNYNWVSNYSFSKKIFLESDSDGAYATVKNSYFLEKGLTSGTYDIILNVYGYKSNSENKFELTKGVAALTSVKIVDTDDKIRIIPEGAGAKDWTENLYNGEVYDNGTDVTYGEINVALTKNSTTYSGRIFNRAFYDEEYQDVYRDYIVREDDGSLSIVKKNLMMAFVDGIYSFTFDVYGFESITVSNVEIDFGREHNPNMVKTLTLEEVPVPYAGQSTEIDMSKVKITGIDKNGATVDVTKDCRLTWTETVDFGGLIRYNRTSDKNFVNGKTYYLFVDYSFQWEGNDRKAELILTYDGNEYKAVDNSMGAAPVSYLDTYDSRDYAIGFEVSPLIKINVPTAKTDLVYNGKEQIGVEEGKGYTVTNNTGTNAGEYTAIVKPNAEYSWNDGTQSEKEVKFTIAKAEPAGYKKPELTAVYGQSLKEIDLTGTGWSWVSEDTVINGVGEKSYSAKYTPSDTDNYNTVLDTLNVTVSPKAVVEADIKLPEAGEITYGDKLSSSKLTVEGWSWVEADQILNVVNNGAKVQYTIPDDVNYDYSGIEGYDKDKHVIIRTIAVKVNKADPDVKTPELKAVYNQSLKDIVLPERWTFVETDLSTKVGNVGTKGIEITYTPEDKDLANYNIITRTAVLVVVKAKPEYKVPVITDSVPADTKLSEIKLDKGWKWENENQTVGDNNIAIFTPDDTANYLTVKANVVISVRTVVSINDDTNVNLDIKTEVKDTDTNSRTEDVLVSNNGLTGTVQEVIKSQADDEKEQKTVIVTNSGESTSVEAVIKEAVNNNNSDIKVSTSVQKKELTEDNLNLSQEVETELKNKIGDTEEKVTFLDLSVAISVEVSVKDANNNVISTSSSSGTVKELAEPVMLTVSIEMPEDNGKEYDYYVVFVHTDVDGNIVVDKYKVSSVDEINGTVTFQADKFSTYAIVPVERVNAGGSGNGSSGSSSSGSSYRAPNTKA